MANTKLSTLKEKITKAFRALRRRDIIARQNFTCCQSCGWYEIDQLGKKRLERGKPVRGYVFYHRQDTASFTKGRDLYLAFGTDKEGVINEEELGNEICDVLKEFHIDYEWNGDSNTRIKILGTIASS